MTKQSSAGVSDGPVTCTLSAGLARLGQPALTVTISHKERCGTRPRPTQTVGRDQTFPLARVREGAI